MCPQMVLKHADQIYAIKLTKAARQHQIDNKALREKLLKSSNAVAVNIEERIKN